MGVKEQVAAMRRARHNATVDAMRDGMRLRATTVPAKRGKGSYRRKTKHNTTWE